MTIAQVTHAVFDPRGRANRKGFLLAVALLTAIEIIGASLIWGGDFAENSLLVSALKAFFVWIAIATACKRLHDLGLSAWWLPAAATLQVMWMIVLVVAMLVSHGVEQMQPGADGYVAMLTGCILPIIASALWLQITPGESRFNRFGPPPDGSGFSSPGERDPFWPMPANS